MGHADHPSVSFKLSHLRRRRLDAELWQNIGLQVADISDIKKSLCDRIVDKARTASKISRGTPSDYTVT